MKQFGEIMFTRNVQAEQTRQGSREAYEKMTARPAPAGLSEAEIDFISARDSFYMASVSENGWPYVQHRGGPRGFFKILSPTRLGFADYRGNKQYISTGNFKSDDRTSLFLMDYPNRRRLKMLARAKVQSADAEPALAEALAIEGQGRVERLFTLDIEAFDWNCPQFITPRFTAEELQDHLAPVTNEIDRLRAENERLKQELRGSS